MTNSAVSITQSKALQLATEAAKAIGPVVHGTLSVAAADIARTLAAIDMPYKRHSYVYPLLTRGRLSDLLVATPMPEGWQVEYNGRQMGKLCVRSNEMELRLLKERKSYPGGIPPAGRNKARREWYSQPALFELPDTSLTRHLLLLWDYQDTSDLSAGITLRIVMTEGPGKYPGRVPYLASLPIDEDFANADIDSVAFAGEDEAEDFYAIIDEMQSHDSAEA